MQCLRGYKKTHFPHTVHYCCSSMLCLSETHWFLQSSSFWESRRALIGQLSGALWLSEYLKRETEMLRPLPYCDDVSQRDETRTIKPITNEAFVASIGDIITDYDDLFTCRVASRWQTTSTTPQCSKLAFESSVAETYVQARSQKRQSLHSWNCPTLYKQPLCKAGIVGYSSRFRK